MGNAPIQMGIKTHKQSYQHGETMTGTVYVSVNSVHANVSNYRGIQLQFAGHENTEVRIEEKSGDTTSHRTERESNSILRVEVPLITFPSPLRVAKYEFPFEWKLPNTPLPSSFRHKVRTDRKGHCEIRYALSAYLTPQDTLTTMGNRNNGTTATQTIHFIGAPTRSIPEPLHLAEERTAINGFCCCWKLGHVSLGWEADTIVLTPLAPCHLNIWGSNTSSLPVQSLRVQLIQSIQWQAGSVEYQRHTRTDNTTLVDYNIDVSHLPQWDPVLPNKANNAQYQPVDPSQPHWQEDGPPQAVPTSFQVPVDAMDSYQGMNCTVEHTLIVTAVTRMMATTPTVSYKVHIQRMLGQDSSTASLPVATAWMEEAEYQDIVLPNDWTPDEKVPVIHLTDIRAVTNESAFSNVAMAQAVVVDTPTPAVATSYANHPASFAAAASPPPVAMSYTDAPKTPYSDAPRIIQYYSDDPNTAYAHAKTDSTADTTTNAADEMAFARPAGMTDEITPTAAAPSTTESQVQLSASLSDLQAFQTILRQIDPNDTNTLRRVEHQVRSRIECQRALATMTQEDFQYLCQAGTPLTISRIAFLLATELNKAAHHGFRGAFLVALMQLPVAQDCSISLIGSLTEQISDLEESSEYIKQSLSPDDAEWFQQRIDEWAY